MKRGRICEDKFGKCMRVIFGGISVIKKHFDLHAKYFPDTFVLCNDDHIIGRMAHGDAEVRANFDRWLRAFAANGGNCIRLWAGHRSLEVMPEKAGVYDPERTKTLKGIVALCEELGIKVKITFESFRMCLSAEAEVKRANPKGVNFNYNHVFNRPLYAPYADSVAAFFTSQECRRIYLGKAQYLKDIGFGDSLAVYCWELWNDCPVFGLERLGDGRTEEDVPEPDDGQQPGQLFGRRRLSDV